MALVTPRNIDKYLTSRYYDASRPGAFTSVSKLYQAIKKENKYDIPFERIREWGQKQDAITLNTRPIKKNKPIRKVITGLSNSLWDCDLMQLNQERFVKANAGYSFVLVCVDILSRFARVAPLKSKSAKDVVLGFDKVLKDVDYRVGSIRCDRGKEFTCQPVKDLMKKHSINLYFTNASTKSNYAEIFIKNLKRRLFRLFQHRSSYEYLDKLPDVIRSYNTTTHSSIRMAPADVGEENEKEIWNRTYFPPADYKKAFREAANTKRIKKKKKTFEFAVGDEVRVSYLKEPFSRDYDEKYSGEVFKVRKRRLDQGIPIYFLTDYGGDEVKGAFYERELKKIIFDRNALFKIDKVLKKRKINGRPQSLVQYQSWPKKYAEWIDDKGIVSLTGDNKRSKRKRGDTEN